MRIPLTGYAVREILLYGGLSLAATAVVFALAGPLWYLGFVPIVVAGWILYFFRDPGRRVPQGERLLVSPADGHVTHVETIDTPAELGGRGQALRVSIFLSIFDCHLNRAPCAGRVESVTHRPGRFLNALRAASAAENEQNTLILRPDATGIPVLVRQIAGVIARRIVCTAAPEDHLATGQRFGMIKFGSRTDLVVPTETPVELRVGVGDKVKAGQTILGQFT